MSSELGSRFDGWLAEARLDLQIRRFPEGTRTAEDAARAIGCSVGQIVKSLVFLAAGNPVVALVSGADRLDLGRLEAVAGGPVAKAGAAAVRQATGYAIGGVPPFGHAAALPVYMDPHLLEHDLVWAAAGRPDSVFAIEPAELQRLSGASLAVLT